MLKKLHVKEFIRIISLMEKRKVIFLVSMLVSCVSYVGQQIIFAFVNKEMINAASNGESKLLVNAILLAITALIIICIIGPIFGYIFESSMKKSIVEIKLKVFSHIIRLPISYFEFTHSGEIISKCTNDMNVLENAYRQLNMVVLSCLYGIGSSVVMFWLEWRLAALLIILGIISSIINTRFSGTIRKYSDEIQSSFGLLTQYFVDILSGFRVIKLFNIGNIIIEKYLSQNCAVANLCIKRVQKNSQLDAVNHLLASLNLVGILVVSTLMVRAGSVEFGTAVAIISLQGAVSSMFSNIGHFFTQLQVSLAGAGRIFDLLDEKEEDNSYNNKVCFDSGDTVRFYNIVFGYDSKRIVIENIDFSVAEGQIAALVGESGGGKSTLIKLLLGLYKPKSGVVLLKGKPLWEYSLQELRNKIGYVPQDAYLFDGTIKENISYGKQGALMEEIVSVAKAANAHDFIIQQPEGYDTLVGERGVRLSGGQKQRIAIARAMLKNAPILILDEATSALDSDSEQLVQDAINTLMKGRTTIAIAHRLSTITDADIIYVLENGKIVERGNHGSLLEMDGVYKQFYKLQFDSSGFNV